MYLGVLQKTKVMKGFYMRKLSGYYILAANATIWHWGSVAVFYYEADQFVIKDIHLHGPNIDSGDGTLWGATFPQMTSWTEIALYQE